MSDAPLPGAAISTTQFRGEEGLEDSRADSRPMTLSRLRRGEDG